MKFLTAVPSTFAAWQASSNALFDKFRGQMVTCSEVGMDADAFITERKGGYFLYRRPHPEVAYAIERVGKEISAIAPEVLVYSGEVLHTTYTDYMVAAGFNPPESPSHAQVVSAFGQIAQGIAELSKLRSSRPAAKYGDLLFSVNTFMFEGHPLDDSHLADAQFMQEMGKQLLGTELRLPWGSHISFGRVAKRIEPAAVQELVKYCKAHSPLMSDGSYPFVAVEAGFYTVSPEHGFQSTVTDSFKF
jgi:hypothetical protein